MIRCSTLRLLEWLTVGEAPRLSPLRASADAAADWLARAQDATPDDGVAAYYDVKQQRWAASYPETTGYIIPTLYAYAQWSGRAVFAERATRMAHWECDLQMDSGAVRAGNLDVPDIVPTIFNTGQVLFGWAAAYEHTGDVRFAIALRRAADWLVSAQDGDGAWRRFGSPHSHAAVNTYNTRSAYGLIVAARTLDEPGYALAACANIDWALTRVNAYGWLANNDLDDDRRPLTHTIAYALRGILEVGIDQGRVDYVECAARSAAAVAQAQRADGALPARLDHKWRSAALSSCLTGNVQMASVWLRLASHGIPGSWRASAKRCIAFTQATQRRHHAELERRGAIAGSAPLRGEYMSYRYPNWAPKFYIDALMALDAAGESA